MIPKLDEVEDAYYRQWMTLGGETHPRRWSKRRAMFWGLLQADNHDLAYQRGRQVGARLGQPPTVPSGADLVLTWFFAKAVVAELFTVERRAQTYVLRPRPGDAWAPLLAHLARSLRTGTLPAGLPRALPPRPLLVPLDAHTLLARGEAAFGRRAVPALHDILAANDTEAREFQLALTRGDVEAARYWFECEWSFRAKEQFRGDIEARQSKACACCGLKSARLQLNHRTKVRDWGRTSLDNLEAVCFDCHRHIDRHGRRCAAI